MTQAQWAILVPALVAFLASLGAYMKAHTARAVVNSHEGRVTALERTQSAVTLASILPQMTTALFSQAATTPAPETGAAVTALPPAEPPKLIKAEEWANMGDTAFAKDLDGTSFDAVAGYLASPFATHSWSESDWLAIPGPKLPIYVASPGRKSGRSDGRSIVNQLRALGVPKGCVVVVDMETMVDKTYILRMYNRVHNAGYKLWVYGSSSTVFKNPQANGYWVADYAGKGPFMYAHTGTRATQWTNGSLYDQSTVKKWTLHLFWR